MKFLLDMPISPAVTVYLREKGFEADHWSETGDFTADDEVILEKANQEEAVLLSMDLDFGAILALQKRGSPGVILFRMRFPTVENVCAQMDNLLNSMSRIDMKKSLIIVRDRGIRIRPLPIE